MNAVIDPKHITKQYFSTKHRVVSVGDHIKVTKKPAGCGSTYRVKLVMDEAKAKGC